MSHLESKANQRLEHLKAAVKRAGIKLTPQRLEIFREIVTSVEHPDAEAVFRAVQARMPMVSLDTVYRTLWLLHELGLVTTLGPRREGIRFDANLEQHHHYVCLRCGLVRDFESRPLDSLRIPAGVKQLGSIVGAHVEVRGVCASCARDKNSSRPTSRRQEPARRRRESPKRSQS